MLNRVGGRPWLLETVPDPMLKVNIGKNSSDAKKRLASPVSVGGASVSCSISVDHRLAVEPPLLDCDLLSLRQQLLQWSLRRSLVGLRAQPRILEGGEDGQNPGRGSISAIGVTLDAVVRIAVHIVVFVVHVAIVVTVSARPL